TQKLMKWQLLWVLNLSDGTHSLLEISDRANIPFPLIQEAADALIAGGLLKICEE
ncbi:MAG: peptidase M28, partial [Hydrococcus sp. RM1_1_31]|nr:peptidase M28 [Hydrococcus sp. RM1_1_31]